MSWNERLQGSASRSTIAGGFPSRPVGESVGQVARDFGEPAPSKAEWLNGPRLVEWLLSRGVRPSRIELGAANYRALNRWKNGGAASVWVLDRILTDCGISLSEVPVDLFYFGARPRARQRKTKRRHVDQG